MGTLSVGVNDIARKGKKLWFGDENGIAREVKKAWYGDENGIAQLVFSNESSSGPLMLTVGYNDSAYGFYNGSMIGYAVENANPDYVYLEEQLGEISSNTSVYGTITGIYAYEFRTGSGRFGTTHHGIEVSFADATIYEKYFTMTIKIGEVTLQLKTNDTSYMLDWEIDIANEDGETVYTFLEENIGNTIPVEIVSVGYSGQ